MRIVLFLCLLGAASVAQAAQHSAVINIEGCTGLTAANKGYASPGSPVATSDYLANYDAVIECLPMCLEPGEVSQWEPVTAGEYTAARLTRR